MTSSARRVVGPGGHLGYVADCRFSIDGPPGPLLAEPRLVGLVVARRHREGFLGYERTSRELPGALAWWFAKRHRGSFLILWEDIESIDEEGVRLRSGFNRWSAGL